MQNFVKKEKRNCCGCGLCVKLCPVKAIEMVEDEEGIQYPEINEQKCIKCGKCKRICIFRKGNEETLNIRYAVKHKDEKVIMSSRSGGVFTALCDYILSKNGIIYGCALDEKFNAVHIKIDKKSELNKINKSKYIQSSIYQILDNVKENLMANKKVLFSGTPCQIAAVSEYIPSKLHNNLFLIEIVCHGVPGNKVFQDYIKYIEKKEKSKVEKVEFRNKKVFGWHNSGESFFTDSKWIHTEDYMTVYNSNMILRESCYNCCFKDKHTQKSDITIGDLWGVEKSAPQFNDNKGTSLVIINSQKGKDIFEEIKKDIRYCQIEEKLSIQDALITPTKRPKLKNIFWLLYKINEILTIKATVIYVKISYRIARLRGK